MSYIKKLQSKSEDTRKQILMVSIVVSMSIVVMVWMYGLGNFFSNKTEAQASNETKPFTLFADSISETYQNISASVGKITSKKEIKAEVPAEKQIDLIQIEHTTN